MSPEQYRKLRQKEQEAEKQKKFGAFGPQSFKSRSLQSFQQDLEKGKVNHLMPMMDAKKRLAKGEIKTEDIPYMQRGGAWDNSDVKSAKKLDWNESDKKYSQNAKRTGLDWMGANQRRGPTQQAKTKPAAKKTDKPNKLFGLF
jgi:hypothetical protein